MNECLIKADMLSMLESPLAFVTNQSPNLPGLPLLPFRSTVFVA